jgi:DNA-binding NarL/FixJ family response regulator
VPFPARVLIVDAHDLPRYGLRSMLSGQADFEVIMEATDGRQAVALSRRLRPDLVSIEVRLPGIDGVAATRLIRRDSPESRIVVVTDDDNPLYLRLAMEAGAAGYVLKTATYDEILVAFRKVLTGETAVDPELATRLVQHLVETPTSSGVSISARELEVLRLVAQGKTNQGIGDALAVSRRTAKAHVERVIARLEVANRTEAVARAIALGLLTTTDPT